MRPFIIGIAGGTGSGKTTIAKNILKGLPSGACVILDHDSYYRDLAHLPPEERAKVNFDHPDSLENELLAQHLEQLRAGHAIEKPLYDFRTHSRRVETETIAPAPVVIVEGILILVDSSLRGYYDVKLFVDTDADLRVFRRIRRDIEERGRTFQSIRDQYYKTVRPMHRSFVEPSKAWADLIIPEGGDNRIALDMVIGRLLPYVQAFRAEASAGSGGTAP